MISVRLEYADIHDQSKLFHQPLFLLSTNLKQQLLKSQDRVYNEKLITEDLLIMTHDSTALELTSSNMSDNDFNLNYILDRYAIDDLKVIYKGANFNFNTDKSVKQYSLRKGQIDHTVTSAYIIKYESKHLSIFEELMKNSVIYFKKHFNTNKSDKTRINMFLVSDTGDYFENLGSRPKRSIDSVFLPKKQKSDIISLIDTFIKPETIQRYKRFGVNHKLTILLEGVPGTGKSSMITAIASYFNFDVAIMSFTPKMTDVGFLRTLRTWERRCNDEKDDDDDSSDSSNSSNSSNSNNKCTILVIEDMDCIFKERKSNDETRNMVTFSGILNGLDGITTGEKQIVILTTNHIEHLDPALIRPGRVDHIMKFDYANKEQIMEMFQIYTGGSEQCNVASLEFYDKVKSLNIKVTTSLLQQYLLKYAIGSTTVATVATVATVLLENIDELKQMHDACNKQRTATDLYS